MDVDAAKRAFDASVENLDKVIAALIQHIGSDTDALSIAADDAFDRGVVVIAANGNFGPAPATVASPANAHKVIGVGDFGVENLVIIMLRV